MILLITGRGFSIINTRGSGGSINISTNGSELQGGDGEPSVRGSAGGGGGYYGGGAGSATEYGGGGGGSAYIDETLVTDFSYSRKNSGLEQKNYGTEGSFKILKVAPEVESQMTVSGSSTKNLKLSTNSSQFGGTLRCKVESSDAQFSPIYTTSANFQSFVARAIVVFEDYDQINNQDTTFERNLNEDGSLTLNQSTFGSNYSIVTFYSKEGNFDLKMNIKHHLEQGQR